ncbi:MAG: DNA polymerase III subunit chi [Pseudomonadota bacterium]
MTRVDFYVLPDAEPDQRDIFACRLTDKAFRAGHRVYLHTPDQAAAERLDALLWSFRPQAFIPHGLVGSDSADRVAVGWHDEPGEYREVMINLSLQVPDFVGRFERVCEVVVQEPGVRDALRQSWKHYQHYGYPLQKQEL